MKKLIILILSILTLASCNDWLNVVPKGQVEASDLLSDQKGYNSALAGIYYTLSSSSLYGRELTFGTMDLLAQYWDISNMTYNQYREMSQYNFTGSFANSKFANIWKSHYVAINQCNLILEHLEGNRNDIEYSELMEAEALGLRAFSHMELFRMFGPVIRQQSDLDKISIAYRTKFDIVALEFETGRSVLEKAKQDLLAALELAKDDPITTIIGRLGDANTSLLNANNVISTRGSRMNYFAILGMLARVEQLLLNQDAAYTYADRIIRENETTETFKFVTSTNLNNDSEGFRDYNYSSEMLFGIYCEDLYNYTNPTFGMGDVSMNGYTSFPITTKLYEVYLNYIYAPDGGGNDNRLRYWFAKREGTDYYDITKLREAIQISGARGKSYYPEIPVIRLSEVYYIACEAQIGKDNVLALSYLNTVRVARNLPKLEGTLSDDALLQSLVNDMRKEFIGEGRMFPTYKRLYHPIFVQSGKTVEPTETMFVFPIPEDEYEYSPNIKPSV